MRRRQKRRAVLQRSPTGACYGRAPLHDQGSVCRAAAVPLLSALQLACGGWSPNLLTRGLGSLLYLLTSLVHVFCVGKRVTIERPVPCCRVGHLLRAHSQPNSVAIKLNCLIISLSLTGPICLPLIMFCGLASMLCNIINCCFMFAHIVV